MKAMRDNPIQTARLTLRPYREDDRATFVRWNTDPVTRRYMDRVLTIEQANARFDTILVEPGLPERQSWAIEFRESGALIGHIFLSQNTTEEPVMRHADGAPELGYIIDPARQGCGFATEAGEGILEYALGGAGAASPARIVACVDDGHAASIRVLEKLGFQHVEFVQDDPDGDYHVYLIDRAP